MPFIDTYGDGETEFYNVVRAVGKNCPNQFNDVKLIQLMLRQFYSASGSQPPKGQMVADGICGPITKNWILKFQLDMRAWSAPVLVDGRIDRIRDHQQFGAISNTRYCLSVLNDMCQNWNPGGWASIPGMVLMDDADSVPAPGNDYVPESPAGQSTSAGGRRFGSMSSSQSTAAA